MQHQESIPHVGGVLGTGDSRTAALTYDHRVTLHGVTWDQYEALLAIRGDTAGVRMAYLEGELELMSPSRSHESIKKVLARLLEAYGEERGLELNGFGSMTLRNQPKERGVEPDECYELGGPKEFPDIAIEVVWTSGGLDKLDIYQAFGVREVWIWREGRIEIHALRSGQYERIAQSELLPELDLAKMAELAESSNQTQAVRDFRASLRGK
jgi:Uma2 family endonuclease